MSSVTRFGELPARKAVTIVGLLSSLEGLRSSVCCRGRGTPEEHVAYTAPPRHLAPGQLSGSLARSARLAVARLLCCPARWTRALGRAAVRGYGWSKSGWKLAQTAL